MYEITVVGLGFVGLPLLVSIADQKNFFKNIFGIEVNNIYGKKKIKEFKNNNHNLFFDNKLNKIYKKNKKKIIFTTDHKKASNSDFIFFCYPLNIKKNLKTNFEDYCNLIGKYLKVAKNGAIFILNSTSPPGITSQVIQSLKKKNIIRDDVFFVYSPERVTPGLNYYESIVNSHRVFSSNSNIEVSKKVKKLFSIIFNTKKFQVTELKKYEEAECTKILENSYRAANIALIEEWTILAEKFGIDLFSVINAIKHRSTHSNIMKPGLGVGGYCLTKDPYFAKFTSNKFLKNKLKFPFVDLTMKINSKMHLRVCKQISELIHKNDKIKKILIGGISYAQNVDDIRNSRSLDMIDNIFWKKNELTVFDPVVKILSYKKVKIIKKIKNLNVYDLIIFNVKHKQFEKIDFNEVSNNKFIIDTNNVLTQNQINDILTKKIKLKIIGRGDI